MLKLPDSKYMSLCPTHAWTKLNIDLEWVNMYLGFLQELLKQQQLYYDFPCTCYLVTTFQLKELFIYITIYVITRCIKYTSTSTLQVKYTHVSNIIKIDQNKINFSTVCTQIYQISGFIEMEFFRSLYWMGKTDVHIW